MSFLLRSQPFQVPEKEKYYLMIYGIQAVQGACNATLIEMLKFTNAGFSFVEK